MKKRKRIKWDEVVRAGLTVLMMLAIGVMTIGCSYFMGKKAAYAIQTENTNISIPCPYVPPFKTYESKTTECDGTGWTSYKIQDGSLHSFYCSDKNEALWLAARLNQNPNKR
jgi:hypothetical protein